MTPDETNETNQGFPERPLWREILSDILWDVGCMFIGFWAARLFFNLQAVNSKYEIMFRSAAIGASVAMILTVSIFKSLRVNKG